MEAYFHTLLKATMNKAWYYKRIGHNKASFEILTSIFPLYNEMKSSQNPDMLHTCAIYIFTQAVLLQEDYFQESNFFSKLIEKWLEGVKILFEEHKIRMARNRVFTFDCIPQKLLAKTHKNVQTNLFTKNRIWQ